MILAYTRFDNIPVFLTRWQNEFVERAAVVFGEVGQVSEAEARIAELEQMVGKLTMQLESTLRVWQAMQKKYRVSE